jgi:hypothetical protein
MAKISARERLSTIEKVYSHGSCPDGSGAAMIVAAAFKECGLRPDFEFIQYKTKRHRELEPSKNAMFIDITPHQDSWESWKKFCPLVLDHHATAAHITEGLSGVLGGPEESGATMAWIHVMCPISPSRAQEWGDFAKLCAIRDNWVKSDKLFLESCELASALTLVGGTNLVNDVWTGTVDVARLKALGKIVYGQQMRKAEKLADGAVVSVFPGNPAIDEEWIKVGAFNCTEKLSSDVCDILIETMACEIALGYFLMREDGEDKFVFSIRTKKSGRFSAKKIAESLGGGGHEDSASFHLGDGLEMTLHRAMTIVSGVAGQAGRKG